MLNYYLCKPKLGTDGKEQEKGKKRRAFHQGQADEVHHGNFTSNPSLSLNYKQIAKQLEADTSTKQLVNEVLNETLWRL